MELPVLTLHRAGLRCRRNNDYLNIASTPHDEPCTQAGYGNLEEGLLECNVFAKQLMRKHGAPPAGAEFFIMENHHDAGIYHDVCIMYDTENEIAEDYAMEVECGCDKWDSIALAELREAGHSLYTAKIIQLKRA